jgi:hypothetical protein
MLNGRRKCHDGHTLGHLNPVGRDVQLLFLLLSLEVGQAGFTNSSASTNLLVLTILLVLIVIMCLLSFVMLPVFMLQSLHCFS